MSIYNPSPYKTLNIKLSSDLLELIEELAEHTHDNWAKLRIEEGWTLGDQRDDLAKTHPGLVPYEELSDSEKEYDRQTATETLKAIQALGYIITKDAKK